MVVTSASITAARASTRKPICRLKLPALAQLNSTSVGPAPASCWASTGVAQHRRCPHAADQQHGHGFSQAG
jgi:hypothetical protein